MVSTPTSFRGPGRHVERLTRFGAWLRRSFVAYARWLDSISWRRFFVLSVLAMITAGVLSQIPPFSTRWGEDRVTYTAPRAPRAPSPPVMPAPPATPSSAAPSGHKGLVIGGKPYEVTVDLNGVRIRPSDSRGVSGDAAAPSTEVIVDHDGVRIRRGGASRAAGSAASAASAAASGSTAASAARAAASVAGGGSASSSLPDASPGITVPLPPGANSDEVRDAIKEAESAIEEAIRDASEAAADAAAEAAAEAQDASASVRHVTRSSFRVGDHLPQFTFLLIVLSVVTKFMAAGRFKAEAQAVVATEMAESEALKRQVVEARMAAMQAQVEPHFLFNTLASIDHLIETDPPRASKMQKNLIALLRASMPSMREANARGTRDLGRELAVIRPYLEILKVRMEDRLETEIRVTDGLLSAEFPPMMLQGLVENAIKHGLEPKAEGGRLTVAAEIVHGKLAVTVADTGVGFGRAATAGTGIGLTNIRERLQLLYGGKAALTVSDNPGGGTSVTIAVPYTARDRDDGMAAGH